MTQWFARMMNRMARIRVGVRRSPSAAVAEHRAYDVMIGEQSYGAVLRAGGLWTWKYKSDGGQHYTSAVTLNEMPARIAGFLRCSATAIKLRPRAQAAA